MADHNGTRRVIISVGGGKNQKTSFPEKKWPHFEQLARIIVTRSNWHICFIGGDDDVEETQAIISKLPESRDRITNQVGKLDLSQLPNFIKDYDAVVSVDTGIAHIASCVFEENHQRIFTLFGPTDANSWAAQQPKGGRTIVISSQQDCSPCYLDDGHYKSCPFDGEENKKCMKLISAEHVFTIMRLELT
jgi:ADP-heptose:LPS heptosyltransferase